MKKTLAALLTVAMTLSLTACGGGDGSSTKEPAGSDSGSSFHRQRLCRSGARRTDWC